MILLEEIEQALKDIFEGEDGMVQTFESVIEKEKDFNKLVVAFHNLAQEDTNIIHTKIIFKIDNKNQKLIDKSFMYLYEINCQYRKVEFNSVIDMKEKLTKIIKNTVFGEDILILSDFIQAPAMFLNYYMRREDITEYSIFDVKYEPKFKIVPCEAMTFDFKIDVNNNYILELSINKIDRDSDDDKIDTYVFQFKFMEEITTKETDTLNNIHYIIGSSIASIIDKKVKS